jgi:hypothetical protein
MSVVSFHTKICFYYMYIIKINDPGVGLILNPGL